MLTPILSTKLFVPEIQDKHVERKALIEKLTFGIKQANKLTLVSAPAGYGKTTLILELIENMKLKCAWISLDDSDNDLTQFLSYLIAALKRVGTPIGIDTEKMISDFNLSATQAPLAMIINNIANMPEKVTMVLDDYHLINSPLVNNAVKFMLEHQPANFHIIVITREDPRLPIAQLRVQRKITEVRMEDLCFSREEAEDFLQRVMELELSAETVKSILSRTEGWAAGLQLAGLSMSRWGSRDMEEFIYDLNHTDRYIIDYLVEEVIGRQTDEVRDFLCKTSILDRMNGALCDLITGRSDSRLMLRNIEKANLFLIPLDSKREWYRYHHLFADSLRVELSEVEEKEIHKKAAAWFAENGLKQEAVKHAIKSGDMPLALKLIEDSTEEAFRNAKLPTLVKWMSSVPEDLIRKSEPLCVRKAWALYITGRVTEAVHYANSLGEGFMEAATPHNKGLLLSFKAIVGQYTGQEDSEELAKEALRLLEPWDPIARISTLNTLGRAQERNGRISEANDTFQRAFNEGRRLGYTFITTLALTNLCTSLNELGKRREAVELYMEYLQGMTREFEKPLPFIGLVYIGLAGLCYDSNELEKAKTYIEMGIELCNSISYHWNPTTDILKARIKFASGEREPAVENLAHFLKTAQKGNLPGSTIRSAAVLVELLTHLGEFEKAEEYENIYKNLFGAKEVGANEEPHLAHISLLIRRRDMEVAFEQLQLVEAAMVKRKKCRALIKVFVLYAEAFYCIKDYENTDLYLDRAVELAEPQEYFSLFLQEEEMLKSIILRRRNPKGEFVERAIGFMRLPLADNRTTELNCEVAGNMFKHSKPSFQYIEKLSNREIEILNLIGKGMSNGEISQTLYISMNTTQWHISHIYSKLGVKSRTQAVLRAHELGIL